MPPIFGGKSLVTSRCFTRDLAPAAAAPGLAPARARARRAPRPPRLVRADERVEQVLPAQPPAGPDGVRPQHRISIAEVPRQCAGDVRVRRVGHVADRDRARSGAATAGPVRPGTTAHGGPAGSRRRPRGGRATTPMPGSDPGRPAAAVGGTVVGPDRVIRRRSRVRWLVPRQSVLRRASPGRLLCRRASPHPGRVHSLVGRADLLTVVAAVDAGAERLPVGPRERPGRLDQPGQAAPGVDHAGCDDGRGRAAVDAPTTRPAPIGDRRLVDRQRRARHHAAQHEPRTGSRTQQIGVLPEPAQAGAVRDLSVDQAVVVGQHPCPVAVAPEVGSDGAERLLQRAVVVRPGIPGDVSVWAPRVQDGAAGWTRSDGRRPRWRRRPRPARSVSSSAPAGET